MKKCQKVWKCENYETILPFSCCPLVFPWIFPVNSNQPKGARQRSGEGVVRRNGCSKGSFWRVLFFSAPLRFSGPLSLRTNLKGAEKKWTLQKHPFGEPFLRTTPSPLLWRTLNLRGFRMKKLFRVASDLGACDSNRTAHRGGIAGFGPLSTIATTPCPSFPCFLRNRQRKPPKKQGFFIPTEPLKSLEKKGKKLEKTRKSSKKRRKNKEIQKKNKERKDRAAAQVSSNKVLDRGPCHLWHPRSIHANEMLEDDGSQAALLDRMWKPILEENVLKHTLFSLSMHSSRVTSIGRCPSTVRPVFPLLVVQLSKQQNRTRTTSSTVLETPPNRTRTKKFPLEELWGGLLS